MSGRAIAGPHHVARAHDAHVEPPGREVLRQAHGEVLAAAVRKVELPGLVGRVLVGERARGGAAERHDARGVHHPRAHAPRRLEHVERAAQVHVVHERGIGRPRLVDRRRVEHRVDALHRRERALGVAHVALDDLDGQAREVVARLAGAPPAANRDAALHEGLDDVGPEEARCSGDQRVLHRRVLPLRR
jgi:hypothetical protein